MTNLNNIFIFLFLIPLLGFSQARTDSVAGTYNRHIWKGVGMSGGNNVDGVTFPEVVGYTISTSDQELVLDKNHCAALTIKSGGGVFGSYFSPNFMTNPEVFYGIWKIVGDTVIITYTKTCCELLYEDTSGHDGMVKMKPQIQNKYFWTGDNYLDPLTEDEKTIFYRGELEMVE